MITARKVCDLKEHEGRRKRDWRRTKTAAGSPASDESYFPELIGREPDPAFAAQVAEEYQRLLTSLGDRELESVALWRMEGFSNDEIAVKLGCTSRTVERKLRIIRGLWEKEIAL